MYNKYLYNISIQYRIFVVLLCSGMCIMCYQISIEFLTVSYILVEEYDINNRVLLSVNYQLFIHIYVNIRKVSEKPEVSFFSYVNPLRIFLFIKSVKSTSTENDTVVKDSMKEDASKKTQFVYKIVISGGLSFQLGKTRDHDQICNSLVNSLILKVFIYTVPESQSIQLALKS